MTIKKLSKVVTILVFLCASNFAFADIAKSAKVYLVSDPGSWVGGAIGAPFVTWVNGVDGVFTGPSNGSSNSVIDINYNDGNFWSFNFAAPTYDPVTNTNVGQPLHVGLYTDAQRYPFNSPTKPGISIYGNGRGNNTQTGWFNILELTYDNNGSLDKFAVDFKQFDESSTTVGLYGSLRFNSSIAITALPVPETETYAMLLAGLGVMGFVARRNKA